MAQRITKTTINVFQLLFKRDIPYAKKRNAINCFSGGEKELLILGRLIPVMKSHKIQ